MNLISINFQKFHELYLSICSRTVCKFWISIQGEVSEVEKEQSRSQNVNTEMAVCTCKIL